VKKIMIFILLFPVFLFSGVFDHLLNKDQNYLFEHNFRCRNSICITSEKNIFDDDTLEDIVKVVKVVLDNKKAVFKIEVELTYHNERKEAFYKALKQDIDLKNNIEYKLYDTNDKYGNHTFIEITDTKRKKEYIEFLTQKYYKIMKSYKP